MQRLFLAVFTVFILVLVGVTSGCGGGKTDLNSTEFITLNFTLSPTLTSVIPPVGVPSGVITRSASWQVPWNELHFSLIDMEKSEPIEPAWHCVTGNTLDVTGDFKGKRLMMKITNRGDIIRHVVQPAEDADAPEFSNLNTFYVVLGAISPLATGSITGFPTIAEAEIMASTSFLSFYGETPLRTDGGTIINGSADYVTFSQDAIGDNHPIKKHAEVLKQIIQSGKLDSKIIALSTLSSATAIRKFFSGFQLVQETNNLTPAELQALLLEGAVTPVITAITPTSVQLDDIATTQFTITGKQFTNTGGTLTATLGETSGTIISTSDTEVVLTFENADEAGTFSLTINREVTANTTNNLDDTASVATVADTKITIIE